MWELVHGGKTIGRYESEDEAQYAFVEYIHYEIPDEVEEFFYSYSRDPDERPRYRNISYAELAEEEHYHMETFSGYLTIYELEEWEYEDEEEG